jgi:polygalacturonase
MTTPATPDWHNVVATYGADPTGVADSTTAFQDALNAIAALTGTAAGGVLYVPVGQYKVSASLTYDSTTPLVIQGDTTAGNVGTGTASLSVRTIRAGST